MEKPEIPVWKNKWFARLHLGSFRKYELLFKAMQFFYSVLVNFADMKKHFQWVVLPPRQILKFNVCAEDFQPGGLCKCRLSQRPSLLISGSGSWPPLGRFCRRKHKNSTACASRS